MLRVRDIDHLSPVAGHPIVTPMFVCPMAGNPCLVTGGRKFPVRGGLYVSTVSFGPFGAYPYVMCGGRLGSVYDGSMGSYLNINMLG